SRNLVARETFGFDETKIGETERRGQLVHPRIDTGNDDRDLVLDSQGPEQVDPSFQIRIRRDDGAAFRGVEQLGRVKAQNRGVPPFDHRFAIDLGAESMGGVIDDAQSMALGDRLQLIDSTWNAIDVDADDRARTRRDRALDRGGVEGQFNRIYI